MISRAVIFEEFVGRKDELSHLTRLHEYSGRYGTGAVVSIVGEAGVGKSRLLSEFANSIAKKRGAFVRVRCEEFPVYLAPVVEGLQALSELRDLRRVAAIDSAITRMTGLEFDGSGDGAERRAATAAAAVKAFAESSRKLGQLTLAVEDVHWSDMATLGVLRSFARAIAKLPIVLVLTYRPQEIAADHQRGELIGSIERERADRLALAPLTYREIGGLIRSAIPKVAQSVVRRVYDLSEGRPYLAEELTRSVAERGHSSDLAPTLQLRSVLLGRLVSLTGAERAVVDRASVLGRNFRSEDLFAIGMPSTDVRSALRAGFELQIFEEREVAGQPWYRFRHALTREIIYREVLAVERQSLHLEVANYLEAVRERPIEFAYHVTASGDRSRIVGANERAGDFAARHGSFSDATHTYETALDHATSVDDVVRLGSKYVVALTHAHDMARLATATPELSARLLEAGRIDDAAEILVTALSVAVHIDFELALKLIALIKPMIANVVSVDTRLEFELWYCESLRHRGLDDEAAASIRQAEMLVQLLPKPTPRHHLRLLELRAVATRSASHMHALVLAARRFLLSSDLDTRSEQLCNQYLAGEKYQQCRYGEAFELYLHAAKFSERSGGHFMRIYQMAAMVAGMIGRFDVVASILERIESEGREPSREMWVASSHYARACGGDFEGLLRRFDRCIELGVGEVVDYLGADLAFIFEEDRKKARDIAVRALAIVPQNLLGVGNLIHAIVEFGNDDEARTVIDALPAQADANLHTAGSIASWTLARARFARRFHRPLEQVQLATEALAMSLETNEWTHIAASHELLGDIGSARAYLESIGASAEVERLNRRCAPPRTITALPRSAAKLTRREEQIARAIGAGASNRQVAERLSIGQRTVETHLANAYAKLDISSRAELLEALSAR